MRRNLRTPLVIISAVVAIGLVVAACGGGGATATPRPQPTPTTAPSPTPAPTATPRPTPTPGVPTPIILQGKSGGTLNLRALFPPRAWDTFDVRGTADYHTIGELLNNLVWPDPYGDGNTLVGDAAERWEISGDGQTLTFFLRKNIKFHDGTPFTSKDVVYNLNRGWKPASATTTFFKARFAAIQGVEAPDDFTVKIMLSRPSNAFLQNLATNQFMMYPSHIPIDQWKNNPVGTGPFKFKSATADQMEHVRNPSYWKPGLPYVDGVVLTVMGLDTAVAAFRTGRIDAAGLDVSAIEKQLGELKKQQGFVPVPITTSRFTLIINQRKPWTDPKVREAISLGIDRAAIAKLTVEEGVPFAAPLLPPELGGQWGISTEALKDRPGFRADKAQDRARAKQLLAEAGVDPATVTVNILADANFPLHGEAAETQFAALGFKTKLDTVATAALNDRLLRGDYDFNVNTPSISFDDPSDYLDPLVVTGGALNYGKWSDPELDRLLSEQDRTQDAAKRKQLLLDVQELALKDNFIIPEIYRRGYMGYMPSVRNYPTKLPFLASPWYRWEQVWLERK